MPVSSARSLGLTPNKRTGRITSYVVCAESLSRGRMSSQLWVNSRRSYLFLGTALLQTPECEVITFSFARYLIVILFLGKVLFQGKLHIFVKHHVSRCPIYVLFLSHGFRQLPDLLRF